jgi:hypothetical protein
MQSKVMRRRENGKVMDDDGFVLVERRRHRRQQKGFRQKVVKSGRCKKELEEVYVGMEEEETKRSVESMCRSLRKTEFYENMLSSIKDCVGERVVQEIVCYGVGRVSAYRNSRVQLATAVLLKEDLRPVEGAYFFDPFTSKTDTNIMEEMGFKNIDRNEEGKRSTLDGGPTVYFMPHCDLWLYSNVLWANWSKRKLSSTIVVGNSFKSYGSNTAFSGWKIEPDENCVFRTLSMVQEIRIPVPSSSSAASSSKLTTFIRNAFNNTCAIHFPNLSTDLASSVLSSKPKEFYYDDALKRKE